MADNKLATMIVEIKADTDKLKAELNALKNQTRSNANAMTNSFSGFGKSMASLGVGAIGVTTIFKTLKSAVQKFIEDARAFAKVEQAVKQTGEAAGFTAKELRKVAGELQKLTGIGDEKILNDVTAQLLSFPKISGDVFKRAQVAVLDLATLLDGDLKSAAIQVGKALQDPVNGINAMTRSGVAFTEQQKEQIKTLVESNRLFEAQTLILDEINKQYGGQAEALANVDGGWQKFGATLGDFLESIGAPIVMVLSGILKLIEGISDLIGTTESLTSAEDDAKETYKESLAQFDLLAAKYLKLRNQVNKTAYDTFEYKKVIGQLQSLYPNYFKNIDLEKSKINDVETALINARTALNDFLLSKIQSAVLTDLKDEIGNTLGKIIKTENNIAKLKKELNTINEIKGSGASKMTFEGVSINIDLAIKNKERQIKAQEDVLEENKKFYNELEAQIEEGNARVTEKAKELNIIPPKSSGGGGGDSTKEQLEAQLKLQRDQAATKKILREQETQNIKNEFDKQLQIAINSYKDDLNQFKILVEDKKATQQQYSDFEKLRTETLVSDIFKIEKNKAEKTAQIKVDELSNEYQLNRLRLQTNGATAKELFELEMKFLDAKAKAQIDSYRTSFENAKKIAERQINLFTGLSNKLDTIKVDMDTSKSQEELLKLQNKLIDLKNSESEYIKSVGNLFMYDPKLIPSYASLLNYTQEQYDNHIAKLQKFKDDQIKIQREIDNISSKKRKINTGDTTTKTKTDDGVQTIDVDAETEAWNEIVKAIINSLKIEKDLLIANEELRKQQLKESDIERYYEELKFADDDYLQHKLKNIKKEADALSLSLDDKLKAQKFYDEQRRILEDEYYEYRWKKLNDDVIITGIATESIASGWSTALSVIANGQMSADEKWKAIGDSMLQTGIYVTGKLLQNYITTLVSQLAFGNSFRTAEIAAAVATGTALASAYSTAAAMASIASFGGAAVAGGTALASTVALAKGLASVPGFQKGGDFIVPQGYPNDTFPMLVESGERVQVTPRNVVNRGGDDSAKYFIQLINAVRANTATVAKVGANNVSEIYLDGEKVTKKIISKENKFNKNGVNVDDL